MKKTEFKFKDTQRKALLTCWQRKSDRDKVEKFLVVVELQITIWLSGAKKPTPERKKIAHAKTICEATTKLLYELDSLPTDVSDLMNVFWLHHAYGDEYFSQADDASAQDKKTARQRTYAEVCHAIANAWHVGNDERIAAPQKVEFSKLPPDFLTLAKTVKGFLRPLVSATEEMEKTLVGAKQWQNKDLEKRLVTSIGSSYQTHFGKRPSGANGSTFRKLTSELSKILGYDLGANIVKDYCDTIRYLPLGFDPIFLVNPTDDRLHKR